MKKLTCSLVLTVLLSTSGLCMEAEEKRTAYTSKCTAHSDDFYYDELVSSSLKELKEKLKKNADIKSWLQNISDKPDMLVRLIKNIPTKEKQLEHFLTTPKILSKDRNIAQILSSEERFPDHFLQDILENCEKDSLKVVLKSSRKFRGRTSWFVRQPQQKFDQSLKPLISQCTFYHDMEYWMRRSDKPAEMSWDASLSEMW